MVENKGWHQQSDANFEYIFSLFGLYLDYFT